MKITVKGKVYYVSKYTPAMVMEADRLLEKGTTVKLGDEPEFMDEVVPFIAGTVFAGQFSADDFLNGYESPTVMMDVLGVLGAVRGTIIAEMANFPAEESEKNAPRDREIKKA